MSSNPIRSPRGCGESSQVFVECGGKPRLLPFVPHGATRRRQACALQNGQRPTLRVQKRDDSAPRDHRVQSAAAYNGPCGKRGVRTSGQIANSSNRQLVNSSTRQIVE